MSASKKGGRGRKKAARKSAESKSTESKPAKSKPAKSKPAKSKPAKSKPAKSKPAKPKSTESKPAESKPAESKLTESKPAKSNADDMARELSENMLLLVLQRISEYLGVPSDVLDAIKIELMNIFSFIVLRGLRCHINKKESKLMLKFNVDPGAPDERRGSKSASNLDIEDGTRILLAMQEASELLMKHESFSKRVEKGDIMSKVIAFECDVDGSDLCVSLIFDDVSNLKKAFDFLLGIINLGFRHHECDELKGPVHPIPVPAPGRG